MVRRKSTLKCLIWRRCFFLKQIFGLSINGENECFLECENEKIYTNLKQQVLKSRKDDKNNVVSCIFHH